MRGTRYYIFLWQVTWDKLIQLCTFAGVSTFKSSPIDFVAFLGIVSLLTIFYSLYNHYFLYIKKSRRIPKYLHLGQSFIRRLHKDLKWAISPIRDTFSYGAPGPQLYKKYNIITPRVNIVCSVSYPGAVLHAL